MNIGELIKKLQKLDPELPVFREGNMGGTFVPYDTAYYETLIQSKDESDFYACANDPLWNKKNFENRFNEPFEALIL